MVCLYRWLDEGEEDGAIERILEVSDSPIEAKQGKPSSLFSVGSYQSVNIRPACLISDFTD